MSADWIPLFKVAMADEAEQAVGAVLRSGFIGQGPRNADFEAALCDVLGTPNVVTVNSATSGLHLALHMVMTAGSVPGGAGPWDDTGEVLTTPLTCTATNWPAVVQRIPFRWVDIDPRILNMSMDDLARKIGPHTRAVVLVHWAGYPVDLDELSAVLDDAESRFGRRPVVIEDCAHAWGSTYRGRRVGIHGNVAVFSFQAIKHLTCGDGGAVVFPDEADARRARRLRWYGIDRETENDQRFEQDVPEAGFKFHMNDIASAIGLANLPLAEANIRVHREHARRYDSELAGIPGVRLLERRADRESSNWIYTLLVERRADFIRHLAADGVHASGVHMRNDVHTAVVGARCHLPGVDETADAMVSVPVGWWLDEGDVKRVVASIAGGW